MDAIQALEARRLFAQIEVLVSGTPGDDVIVIQPASAETVSIDVNGNVTTVPADRLVRIDSQAGNDRVALAVRDPIDLDSGIIGTPDPTRFVVDAGPGDDTVFGSVADDAITGAGGNDRIYGRGGNDELAGGTGNDYLFGAAGNDFLIGGPGRDRIRPGGGSNLIRGGEGIDHFLFEPDRPTSKLFSSRTISEGTRFHQQYQYLDGATNIVREVERLVSDTGIVQFDPR